MVQVHHIGDMHVVSSTEFQRNFGTIVDDVCEKYDVIHIRRGNEIVGKFSCASGEQVGRVETFGEE